MLGGAGEKGDVCLEWVDLGFVNIRNTVLGLIDETLSTLIDYYIFLGSEHHRVYIPYIARIHRCKRLWCSIMDALTWGGGLVVRSVAEECSGGIGLGKTELEKKIFDYAEGRRLLLLFVRWKYSFIYAKNWMLGGGDCRLNQG